MAKRFSNIKQIEEENDPGPYGDTDSDNSEDSGDEDQDDNPALKSSAQGEEGEHSAAKKKKIR